MHRRWGVAGPICHCSALCVVIGLSLPRTRRRWWAHLSSFGTMRRRRAILIVGPSSSLGHPHRWVVTWPILVVVGGPIHHHRVAVRAYSSSLERHRVRLIFIGSRCPTLRRWVLIPSCWRHSHEQKMSAWSEARKKENHAFVTY